MELRLTTRSNMVHDMMDLLLEEVNRVVPASRISKKIVIYGAGARGIVFYEILRSTGHAAAYFIDSNKHGTEVCGIPVHEPMKIMGENFDELFVVIAADDPNQMTQTLKSFGLNPEIHIGQIFDHQSIDNGTVHTTPSRMIDFFLGYNRSYNRSSDLPGFKCLDSNGKDFPEADMGRLKIMILGGSTTDPEIIDPLEWNNDKKRDESAGSWPRFLHELLNKDGIRNSIYNGGLGGYTSGQEVLKFIRDGLTLAPDMVIVLDGINDAASIYWHKDKYPKYNSYFRVYDDVINPLLLKNRSKSGAEDYDFFDSKFRLKDGISYGLESDISRADEWYSNQRMMNAVCKEFCIEYVSFLEPFGLNQSDYVDSCDVCLRTHYLLYYFFITWGQILNEYGTINHSTNQHDFNLRELLSDYASKVFDWDADTKKFFVYRNKRMEDFYQNAKRFVQECDYIIDITDTLHGRPDVFYDNCHCTAKGNKIIAERIYHELKINGTLSRALAKSHGRAVA